MIPLTRVISIAEITTRQSGFGSKESGTGVAGKSETNTSPRQ
jgi:hypothetical protein